MKKIFKKLIFLLFIIYKSNCQSFRCKSTDSDDLKVGDEAVLCIHLLEKGTRIAIPIEVDEYSVASIKGIYDQASLEGNDINFLAQVGTITSVFPSVRKKIYNIYLNYIRLIIIIKEFIICLI